MEFIMSTIEYAFKNSKPLGRREKIAKVSHSVKKNQSVQNQSLDALAVYVHKTEISALKNGLLSDRDYLSIKARLARHSNILVSLFSGLYFDSYFAV